MRLHLRAQSRLKSPWSLRKRRLPPRLRSSPTMAETTLISLSFARKRLHLRAQPRMKTPSPLRRTHLQSTSATIPLEGWNDIGGLPSLRKDVKPSPLLQTSTESKWHATACNRSFLEDGAHFQSTLRLLPQFHVVVQGLLLDQKERERAQTAFRLGRLRFRCGVLCLRAHEDESKALYQGRSYDACATNREDVSVSGDATCRPGQQTK